jgi:putative ABC transport system permease protein
MLALLRLALRNLLLHRERGLLLFGVIAGASAVLVGMMTLKTGVARAQREAVTTLISGDLNVGGFFKLHPDSLTPVMGDARPVRAVVEPLVPAGCHLRERGRGQTLVGAGRHRARSFLVGLDPAREPDTLRYFQVKEGSLEALERPRTVALSRQMAGRLRVKVGDVATLYSKTAGDKRNALDVEVVAITERAGVLGETAGLLVSNATLRELGRYRPESVGTLQFSCGEDTDVDALGGHVRQALREAGFTVLAPSHEDFGSKMGPLMREGWAGQRLDVSTWEDESVFLSFVTLGLGALTVLVGLIVMAVIMVGLFMSQSVAVRERTREIGTMRAMGMQRTSVVALFLLEGLLLALAASATGVCVSMLLCTLLRDAISLPEAVSGLFFSTSLPLAPRPGEAVLTVFFITLSAALASIVPALRAASLNPRSAMESL